MQLPPPPPIIGLESIVLILSAFLTKHVAAQHCSLKEFLT